MEYSTNPRMAFLTVENVTQIKKILHDGEMSQKDLAEHYTVSQATISRIMNGEMWPEIPWPGGALGEMPPQRRYYIRLTMRKRARMTKHIHRAKMLNARPVRAIPPDVEMDRIAEEQMRKDAELGHYPDDYFNMPEFITGGYPAIEKYRGMTRKEVDTLPERQAGEEPYSPAPQAEVAPQTRDDQEKLMDWKDVLEKGGKNELVIQAVKEKDKLLKKAIQMLYYVTEQDSWEDERIIKLILSTKKLLSKQE